MTAENVANSRRRLLATWDEPGPGAESKVCELTDVVASAVRPGASLYFGGSLARPNAALFAVTKKFWETDPQFTIITPAFGNQYAPLVWGGLVARAITCMHATVYPAPAPNPVFVEAQRSESIAFEDWSLLSFVQRFMAAAHGLPFWPTKSLVGSDLARDLEEVGAFASVRSPFGEDEDVGVVSALSPDVCFVHGLMADAAGNVVIPPPWYDDVWAAKATSGAVVATVERLVDSDTIRRYSNSVRLTGEFVTHVCVTPFGGHPTQVPSHGFPEVAGYADDYAFLRELRDVCADPGRVAEWTRQWIHEVDDHAGYVAKLGSQRLKSLQGSTDPNSWLLEQDETTDRTFMEATEGELLAALGGRVVADLVESEGLTSGLAGAGAATLSTWVAERVLRQRGISFALIAEAGAVGMRPRPFDPFLFSTRNLSTCTALTDLATTLGTLIGGAKANAVAVLGGGQVDQLGNINSTRVGGRLLTGSGGGNDAATAAKAVVIAVPHRPNRLVSTIEFVTSPGQQVQRIVTDRGVMERSASTGHFHLAAVLQRDGLSLEELVEKAIDNCGWSLQTVDAVKLLPAITAKEIELVRVFDPHGNFVS